jgi:predicted CXXCH cytochrome family protein
LRILIGILLVSLPLTGLIVPAGAQDFHSGGVANCGGCHSMHNAPAAGRPQLLSSDPSSICLNCHAGSGGPDSPSVFSPDGSALTPGGDFYWLTRSFSWLDGSSPGHEHGHNIVADDYNLLADPLLSRSPGGNYPSAQLGCTSCHDPHGRSGGGTSAGRPPVGASGSSAAEAAFGTISGNYRLLGDARYQPPGGTAFNADAPLARQSSSNRFAESDQSHVAYGSGMSEWCGNCHGGMLVSDHQADGVAFQHPAGGGALFSYDQVDSYNSYLQTGDLTGTAATAYLQFVPFERGTAILQLLDPGSRQGADAQSRVTCLSCHRAHASAFADAGRWDFTAELLKDSHPAVGDIGANLNDTYFSYYGRDIAAEFGAGQGPFCEKCHGAAQP